MKLAGVPGPARDQFCLITSIFLLFSKLFKNIDKINGAITKAQKGAPECIKKGTTEGPKMTVNKRHLGMLKFELVPNSENVACKPTLITNFG